MKKFIKITVLLLIINYAFLIQNSTAPWIEQFDAQEVIQDIEFINLNTGWACGRNGLIFTTTNGGKNWTEQINPSTGMGKTLYSIHPIDSHIVYSVGWFETILKTTNGGTNWTAIRNGPWGEGSSYFATFFINGNTGWIGGSGYKIWKTTNGGLTLDSIFFGAAYIRDMYFRNSLEGVLCGEGGIVKKTTNGGLNWFGINIPLNGVLYNFTNISFIDDKYGWVIGRSRPVFYTTDFGYNWDSIGLVDEADLIYCHWFTSRLIGYCGGSYAKMFKTTDGGYTWRQQEDGIANGFFTTFRFYNDSIGWTSGAGKILHTTTGGQTTVEQISSEVPKGFELHQNFPNPFNSQTTIKFDIKKKGNYSLVMYDCLGRKRDEVFNEYLNAGSYSVSFNGDELQSGVYFYRLSADGNVVETRKMVLIK